MRKFLKISGITVLAMVLVLVFMLLFPLLFREKFAEIVKNTARTSLRTEMNFENINVSFFHHFPKLTISLTELYLLSSDTVSRDTLISAKEVSFGVNLMSVFKGPLRISAVYVNRGKILLKYNEKGNANFDVVRADTNAQADTSSGTADLKIENIAFVNTDFTYADMSIPVAISCFGINYKGNSNISNNIMKLRSNISMDSLNFTYSNSKYLNGKPVKANLETTVDLKSLSINFDKNDLMIRDVPFEFRGDLDFHKDSYSLFLSLFSQYQEEWISGSVYLVGSDKLWISVKTDVSMKLENWTGRLGVKDVDLKGLFALKLKAQGNFITGPDPESPKDTVILSIPDFELSSSLKNGYFKLAALPEAMRNMSFDMHASSKNHDYRTIDLHLENMSTSFLDNKIEGYLKINGIEDFPVDCRITTSMNLADIRKVIPLDSLSMLGFLKMDLTIKGKYAPDKKLFPVSDVSIDLKDGQLLTKYYPQPVEKINFIAHLTNNTGTISGTKIRVDDLSILFENNPFNFRAVISNPENLDYNITSRGSIDLGKLYRVFSREGMEISGYITTDLHLRGRQMDAIEGRIDRLDNKGKLGLRNISFRSDYLPHELVLRNGLFRFDNDKVWFEKFDSRCGNSAINLDGHLSNVVNYFLSENHVLKGDFVFSSSFVDLKDFMAPVKVPSSEAPAAAGVVMIPSDLDISLKADLKKIRFEDNILEDFLADIVIDTGVCIMEGMQFSIIGCRVAMEASYGSISPKKAFFDFHIKAEDFDVQRAYREIALFRELASSAEKCEGIVSLDYSLKGRLVNDMEPVFPSLEGGGVITLKKVRVMGLKMFNAMGDNLGKDKLKDPDLSKVELKTTIHNNIITLEQTKMKIGAFRLKISGESSFDGKLNLKTRVGLPPMGIIGIPMRILGTMDDPKFRYGRGNNDEQLEESQYTDEIPAEFLERIKNVKEEDDDGSGN